MNLPREPGLSRRLAYGEYIRTRHRSRLQIIGNRINIHSDYGEYETFSDLEDVECGLSIKDLILVSTINTDNFFCSICQEQSRSLCPGRTLICKHTFHISCIETWLSKSKTCPICRLDLSSHIM